MKPSKAPWTRHEAHQGKDFWPGKTGLLMWLMEQIGKATDKQPGGTTKLGKALQNIDVTKRVLVENSCPSEFGLEDCENNPESGCTLCCEDCWNQEVGE